MASPNQMFGSSRPRPAFLSSLGSGTPTGLTPPSQNRPENDRQRRNERQKQELQNFKNQFTKAVYNPNTGGVVKGLTQATFDAPRSLTAERQRLSNIYGPTLTELVGDMGRGIGSIMGGFAEKGTPMMNLAKSVGSGIQNFFAPANPTPINPMPMVPTGLNNFLSTGLDNLQSGFNNFMQSGQNFNMMLGALTPEQRRVYDQAIMVPGTTREDAFREARGIQRMATGTPFSANTISSVASSTPSNIPATLAAGPPNQNMSGMGSIGQAIYQMYINMGRSSDEALTESREFERQMAERGFTQAKPSDGGGYSFMAQGGIASLN